MYIWFEKLRIPWKAFVDISKLFVVKTQEKWLLLKFWLRNENPSFC